MRAMVVRTAMVVHMVAEPGAAPSPGLRAPPPPRPGTLVSSRERWIGFTPVTLSPFAKAGLVKKAAFCAVTVSTIPVFFPLGFDS